MHGVAQILAELHNRELVNEVVRGNVVQLRSQHGRQVEFAVRKCKPVDEMNQPLEHSPPSAQAPPSFHNIPVASRRNSGNALLGSLNGLDAAYLKDGAVDGLILGIYALKMAVATRSCVSFVAHAIHYD